MSGRHEVEVVRRCDGLPDELDKLQVEGDQLVVVLLLLVETDPRAELLDGRDLNRQRLEVDQKLGVVEAVGQEVVRGPELDARAAPALEEVLRRQLQLTLVDTSFCVGAVVAVSHLQTRTSSISRINLMTLLKSSTANPL